MLLDDKDRIHDDSWEEVVEYMPLCDAGLLNLDGCMRLAL